MFKEGGDLLPPDSFAFPYSSKETPFDFGG